MLLKCHKDKGDEHVDEEEREDDAIRDVEQGHALPVTLDGAEARLSRVPRVLVDVGPSFARGNREESQPGSREIVVMEIATLPFAGDNAEKGRWASELPNSSFALYQLSYCTTCNMKIKSWSVLF